MKILHFSDIHLGCPRYGLGWLFDKRILGTATHHFRRAPKQHLESLEALKNAIRQFAPDVIICTGDLTTVAAPDEFKAAAAYLHSIISMAPQAFFLPGNHDRYVAASTSAEALREVSELFTPHSLMTVIGHVHLFFLDAAVTRPIWSSSGVVNEEELTSLEKLLEAPREPHDIRILLSHFPIFNNHGTAPGRLHGLLNSRRLRDWAKNGQFDYCLCGHVHHPFIQQTGTFTQLCSGSLTLSDSYTTLITHTDGTTNYNILKL